MNDARLMLLAGESACLTAALLWALSVTVFRKPIELHGARTVNLVKCVLAGVLQGVTVLAVGQADALWSAPTRSVLFLVVSGIVGLVIGDTALFGAVPRIGVHLTLLLQTLAPIFTAVIAATWHAELPTPMQAFGAALILAGVALVVAPRGQAGAKVDPGVRSRRWCGIALGVLAAFGQGAGLVLGKTGMQEMPVLPASFLRLAAAAAGLVALAVLSGRWSKVRGVVASRSAMTRIVPATLMGTYLALFLMMAGVALAPASIAAVLLATSPIFSLAGEVLFGGRRLTARDVAGTLLAVTGVGVLTAG